MLHNIGLSIYKIILCQKKAKGKYEFWLKFRERSSGNCTKRTKMRENARNEKMTCKNTCFF